MFKATELKSKVIMVSYVGITFLIKKKTDMVTKLKCQLPDVDAFGRTGRLSFDPECVKDLGWVPNDWTYKFSPEHIRSRKEMVKDTPKQRSHQMELRSRDK